MPLIRLQKWLSEAGVCSRRQGENLIRAGRVVVNGRVVLEMGTKIDPTVDVVAVDHKVIQIRSEKIYIALYKPTGYVTSCRHPGEKLVIDLVPLSERLIPVGRLDKDSSGLLLLTNDGPLHHLLSHPSFDHEKEYEVTVNRHIEDGALAYMAKGMPLKGVMTRPAKVKRLSADAFQITLKEGRNRQIRRMVRKVGHRVVTLKRTRIVHIRLGDLKEGQWRYLTPPEIRKIEQFKR